MLTTVLLSDRQFFLVSPKSCEKADFRGERKGKPVVKFVPMCGIVGYAGRFSENREYFAEDVVLEGLRRLEYRGYDSAGLAVSSEGQLQWRKKAGKVVALEAEIAARPLPDSVLGIGHTRWATHGGPS